MESSRMSGVVVEITRAKSKPKVPPTREIAPKPESDSEGKNAKDDQVIGANDAEVISEARVTVEHADRGEVENQDQDKDEDECSVDVDDEPVVIGRAVYEHPLIVRLCHWINAVALFVMVGSGLQIFRAFPSFGAKIPQKDLLNWPKAFAIGGWLGGALQWHLTFMWIYIATGVVYLGYQFLSGNYRQVLFTHRDIPGVWPMVKHYFFFGPKPPAHEAYNPLQKQAYTTAIGLGVLSVLTGLVVWKPVQFSWLAWMMGSFHYARIWHFAVMWAILFFVLGHLVMVILHGWNNFVSMLTGWKKDPEY
jgi:Ni/Fe-hydrogenase b-type cytochrome subunit